jgi:hypothetical protein
MYGLGPGVSHCACSVLADTQCHTLPMATHLLYLRSTTPTKVTHKHAADAPNARKLHYGGGRSPRGRGTPQVQEVLNPRHIEAAKDDVHPAVWPMTHTHGHAGQGTHRETWLPSL